jgi:hypothetical protein
MATKRPAKPDHTHLLTIVKRLNDDWEGYGTMPRSRPDGSWGADCSMGCRWFIELKGKLGVDWGVCTNPASHRCGLLTFEHQGCAAYDGPYA